MKVKFSIRLGISTTATATVTTATSLSFVFVSNTAQSSKSGLLKKIAGMTPLALSSVGRGGFAYNRLSAQHHSCT